MNIPLSCADLFCTREWVMRRVIEKRVVEELCQQTWTPCVREESHSIVKLFAAECGKGQVLLQKYRSTTISNSFLIVTKHHELHSKLESTILVKMMMETIEVFGLLKKNKYPVVIICLFGYLKYILCFNIRNDEKKIVTSKMKQVDCSISR